MKRQVKRIVLTLLLFIVGFLVVSCWNENPSSHNHQYSTEWTIDVEPTCTEVGSKSHHCQGCDEKTNITSIPVKGHSFGNWATTKEPTITTTGRKERKCTICGYEEEETISKLTHSHNYSTMYKIDSTKHWKECSCGEKKEEEHAFDSWEIIKENSFTEKGEQKRKCNKCSYEEKEEIPLKTEVETIEELIEYFGDQVNQNLSEQYEVVMKNEFGNSYQTLKDRVTNYRWDLGELTADGKVQNLKLFLEYQNADSVTIEVYEINLTNSLSLNDLLDYTKVSSTDATYHRIYFFVYKESQQNQRNELIKAILEVAVDDGFVYTMDDVVFVENSMSTSATLGTIRTFTVVISNKKGIRTINISIANSKTDVGLINNIQNGKFNYDYNGRYHQEVNFSNNLLPNVILK